MENGEAMIIVLIVWLMKKIEVFEEILTIKLICLIMQQKLI